MIYVLIFALALSVLVLVFRLVRGENVHIASYTELESRTRPVDLEAFRNLMSEEDATYLRSRLSSRQFRRIQRLRILAAADYVRRAAHNAGVVIRLGEVARRSANLEVARTAQELVNSAIRLRLYAFVIQCKLYLDLIAPGAKDSTTRFISAYQTLIAVVGNLGRLQGPAGAGRIATAL